MIDERKDPIVMDFGLARRSTENEKTLTHSGTVIGTPAYMSPEQVDGDNSLVGPPADIYSLGVIFYELLTGQMPFEVSLMSILRQIATVEPTPPTEVRDGTPPELEVICQKMMAKRIEDRYQSMDQVAGDLTDFLRSYKSSTEEKSLLETPGFPSEGKLSVPPEKNDGRKQLKERRVRRKGQVQRMGSPHCSSRRKRGLRISSVVENCRLR
jgi:serine/threonine protein kinase